MEADCGAQATGNKLQGVNVKSGNLCAVCVPSRGGGEECTFERATK